MPTRDTYLKNLSVHVVYGPQIGTVIMLLFKHMAVPVGVTLSKRLADSLRRYASGSYWQWVADCDNVDHTLAASNEKIIVLGNFCISRQASYPACGFSWFGKEIWKQSRCRNHAWRHQLTGEGYEGYKEVRNLYIVLKLMKRKAYAGRWAVESKTHYRRLWRKRMTITTLSLYWTTTYWPDSAKPFNRGCKKLGDEVHTGGILPPAVNE